MFISRSGLELDELWRRYSLAIDEAINVDAIHTLWKRAKTPGEKAAAAAAFKRHTGVNPTELTPPASQGSSGVTVKGGQETRTQALYEPHDPWGDEDEVQHHVDRWAKHRPHYDKDENWNHGDEGVAEQHRKEANRVAKQRGESHTLGQRFGEPADPSSHSHLSTLSSLYGGTTHHTDFHRPIGRGAAPRSASYSFHDEHSAKSFTHAARTAYRAHPVSISQPKPSRSGDSHYVTTQYRRPRPTRRGIGSHK